MLTDQKRLFVVVCHEVCGFQWHYSREKSDDLNFLACREKRHREKQGAAVQWRDIGYQTLLDEAQKARGERFFISIQRMKTWKNTGEIEGIFVRFFCCLVVSREKRRRDDIATIKKSGQEIKEQCRERLLLLLSPLSKTRHCFMHFFSILRFSNRGMQDLVYLFLRDTKKFKWGVLMGKLQQGVLCTQPA